MTECSAEIILAFNRTLDMLAPELEKALFEGKKLFIWLTFSTCYGLYWLFFTKACVYSSIVYGGWHYNPFLGYRDGMPEFGEPLIHVLNNYSVTFLLPAIYFAFAVGFVLRFKKFGVQMKQQISVFLQVFIISVFNASAGFIYVYLQSTTPTQALITVAQLSWLHMHGAPPVIYLAMNKSIQGDCKAMLLALLGKGSATRVAPSTGTAARTGATVPVH